MAFIRLSRVLIENHIILNNVVYRIIIENIIIWQKYPQILEPNRNVIFMYININKLYACTFFMT